MEYRNPRVTVDAAIVEDGKIILIRRNNPPFEGMWALPGGFVDYGERVEDACVREAREETSLDVMILKLVGVYSDPKRDPRGHTCGIVYLCKKVDGELKASDDANDTRWFSLDELPKLAFDHSQIVADVKRLL